MSFLRLGPFAVRPWRVRLLAVTFALAGVIAIAQGLWYGFGFLGISIACTYLGWFWKTDPQG